MKKLQGLQKRLIDLLAERIELFLEERVFLLKKETDAIKLFHPEYERQEMSKEELQKIRYSNDLNTAKVLLHLEMEYLTLDSRTWFQPTLEDKQEERLEDEYFKIFMKELDEVDTALCSVNQAELVYRSQEYKRLHVDK